MSRPAAVSSRASGSWPRSSSTTHDTGPGFDPTTPLPRPGLLAWACKGASKGVLKMPSELPDKITCTHCGSDVGGAVGQTKRREWNPSDPMNHC